MTGWAHCQHQVAFFSFQTNYVITLLMRVWFEFILYPIIIEDILYCCFMHWVQAMSDLLNDDIWLW